MESSKFDKNLSLFCENNMKVEAQDLSAKLDTFNFTPHKLNVDSEQDQYLQQLLSKSYQPDKNRYAQILDQEMLRYAYKLSDNISNSSFNNASSNNYTQTQYKVQSLQNNGKDLQSKDQQQQALVFDNKAAIQNLEPLYFYQQDQKEKSLQNQFQDIIQTNIQGYFGQNIISDLKSNKQEGQSEPAIQGLSHQADLVQLQPFTPFIRQNPQEQNSFAQVWLGEQDFQLVRIKMIEQQEEYINQVHELMRIYQVQQYHLKLQQDSMYMQSIDKQANIPENQETTKHLQCLPPRISQDIEAGLQKRLRQQYVDKIFSLKNIPEGLKTQSKGLSEFLNYNTSFYIDESQNFISDVPQAYKPIAQSIIIDSVPAPKVYISQEEFCRQSKPGSLYAVQSSLKNQDKKSQSVYKEEPQNRNINFILKQMQDYVSCQAQTNIQSKENLGTLNSQQRTDGVFQQFLSNLSQSQPELYQKTFGQLLTSIGQTLNIKDQGLESQTVQYLKQAQGNIGNLIDKEQQNRNQDKTKQRLDRQHSEISLHQLQTDNQQPSKQYTQTLVNATERVPNDSSRKDTISKQNNTQILQVNTPFKTEAQPLLKNHLLPLNKAGIKQQDSFSKPQGQKTGAKRLRTSQNSVKDLADVAWAALTYENLEEQRLKDRLASQSNKQNEGLNMEQKQNTKKRVSTEFLDKEQYNRFLGLNSKKTKKQGAFDQQLGHGQFNAFQEQNLNLYSDTNNKNTNNSGSSDQGNHGSNVPNEDTNGKDKNWSQDNNSNINNNNHNNDNSNNNIDSDPDNKGSKITWNENERTMPEIFAKQFQHFAYNMFQVYSTSVRQANENNGNLIQQNLDEQPKQLYVQEQQQIIQQQFQKMMAVNQDRSQQPNQVDQSNFEDMFIGLLNFQNKGQLQAYQQSNPQNEEYFKTQNCTPFLSKQGEQLQKQNDNYIDQSLNINTQSSLSFRNQQAQNV